MPDPSASQGFIRLGDAELRGAAAAAARRRRALADSAAALREEEVAIPSLLLPLSSPPLFSPHLLTSARGGGGTSARRAGGNPMLSSPALCAANQVVSCADQGAPIGGGSSASSARSTRSCRACSDARRGGSSRGSWPPPTIERDPASQLPQYRLLPDPVMPGGDVALRRILPTRMSGLNMFQGQLVRMRAPTPPAFRGLPRYPSSFRRDTLHAIRDAASRAATSSSRRGEEMRGEERRRRQGKKTWDFRLLLAQRRGQGQKKGRDRHLLLAQRRRAVGQRAAAARSGGGRAAQLGVAQLRCDTIY
eukprot:gene529-biopygen6850